MPRRQTSRRPGQTPGRRFLGSFGPRLASRARRSTHTRGSNAAQEAVASSSTYHFPSLRSQSCGKTAGGSVAICVQNRLSEESGSRHDNWLGSSGATRRSRGARRRPRAREEVRLFLRVLRSPSTRTWVDRSLLGVQHTPASTCACRRGMIDLVRADRRIARLSTAAGGGWGPRSSRVAGHYRLLIP